MFDLSSYLMFLAACTALILVPGPAQALVMARTIADGRRAGALTAVGLNIGTLFHTLAAALGLSAILATSALAFSVVKYIGAAYLIYLGIRALKSSPPVKETSAPNEASTVSALGQAIATGILNPKVALFFLAFLPQFVDPARGHVLLQFLLLGASMAVLDTLYELVLVSVIYRARDHYLSNRTLAIWQTRLPGAVLVALGIRLAAQQR